VIEVSCHGNPIVAGTILNLILQQSVRMAEPGEFTMRAFLNERIDLTQAEAVADIIQASSQNAVLASNQQLRGGLRKAVEEAIAELVHACSLIELELDFVEEGIKLIDLEGLKDKLKNIQKNIQRLINTYQSGKLFAHGAKVAIIGKPNAGKSSLLNALLQEDRAIVSPIPGTTRDVIESAILYKGLKLSLYDTAGVRGETEGIESLGIERTYEQIKSADMILAVVDISNGSMAQDIEYSDKIVQECLSKESKIPLIYVLNKSDIAKEKMDSVSVKSSIIISAKNGDGVHSLKDEMIKCLIGANSMQRDQIVLTNQRHYNCFVNASESIAKALDSIGKVSTEFTVTEVRRAVDYLGEITGKTTSQDIINAIFANFCIGK
ncbi:MAG TPA: tRNA uridine-5-carboxymethylaminomethyl(34) synthesis GTPase MnmE, partial [Candidatus Kapabacteria bacterium]|nr:tRNA uridine-5-carboxymethylaminomethyl(34) synthesis GTPase MnmE [Candidatus Kapabacteria bacterium]